MKILVAVDQNPYSAHAVSEVAKLAANTWANVGLLGVQSKGSLPVRREEMDATLLTADGPVPQALFALQKQFLSQFDKTDCPYTQAEAFQGFVELKKGLYEIPAVNEHARKKFTVRLRVGNQSKEILSEAKDSESDLIVLGCDHTNGCGWQEDTVIPRKIANDAACSVLVVKKKKPVERIICCLDHDRVSQPSLEMINQMVTLHKAPLTIVGLAESLTLKHEVENKMGSILRYYQERNIEPWIELVELGSLEQFIAQESRWGLMALWMGKQSILEKALPRSKVNKVIKGGDASVLILR